MELDELLERMERWKERNLPPREQIKKPRHEPLKSIPREELPDSFYAEGKVSIVSVDDLAELKGYTVEEVLNHFVTEYNCLLYGSRVEFDHYIPQDKKGEVHATDHAGFAMSKAILEEYGLPLGSIEYYFSDDRLISVALDDTFKDTIADSGYVYVIPDRAGFEKTPEYLYIKKGTQVDFMTRIEILKDDIKIVDMTD